VDRGGDLQRAEQICLDAHDKMIDLNLTNLNLIVDGCTLKTLCDDEAAVVL